MGCGFPHPRVKNPKFSIMKSEKMKEAFWGGRPFVNHNTVIAGKENGETILILHGNIIAWRKGNRVTVDCCGWHTAVTARRLRQVGIKARIRNYTLQIFNGKEWVDLIEPVSFELTFKYRVEI